MGSHMFQYMVSGTARVGSMLNVSIISMLERKTDLRDMGVFLPGLRLSLFLCVFSLPPKF